MGYQAINHGVLRDIAHNIRSDHGMPIGKSKRLLDALYEADRALTFKQQVVEREAAQANDPTDYKGQVVDLKLVIVDLRKQLDQARKVNAADKSKSKSKAQPPTPNPQQ